MSAHWLRSNVLIRYSSDVRSQILPYELLTSDFLSSFLKARNESF